MFLSSPFVPSFCGQSKGDSQIIYKGIDYEFSVANKIL